MNVRLLRRIQKKILAEPKRFQMYCWVVKGRIMASGVKIPHCGTAACIAGWAVAMTAKQKASELDIMEHEFWQESADALGVDFHTAGQLIHFCNWPQEFKKIPIEKEGTVAFAKQAAKRIDHFIKTKERSEIPD